MKRIFATSLLALLLASPFAWAQKESSEQRAEQGAHDVTEGQEGGIMEVMAWVNFAILAGALTWMFRKNAVPYFASRAISIRKGMMAADEARAAAERQMADVDARLARLQSDIQAMKDDAMKEAEAERVRGHAETAAALAKIRTHAEQEIEAAAKSARLELKRYAAGLAVGLAEQKIRTRMDPPSQDSLFQGFLRRLDGAARAQAE